jgi:FAD/FMN-containing dehydrogenase/pimeloyl-ACP methyl ester carboxylesterase
VAEITHAARDRGWVISPKSAAPCRGTLAIMTTRTAATPRERLLEGIPMDERSLAPAGVPTAVLEGGAGRPVVLLHGPAGSAAHWFGVLPALTATCRAIAPDLPGHGAAAPADLDAERVLAWLDALIDETCAAPPVLVGFALGGAIAARFAAAHPDAVEQLVLVDAFGLAPFQPEPAFGAALHTFLAAPDERSHDGLWRHCALDLDALQARMGDRWAPFAADNIARNRAPSVQAALGLLMERFGNAAIPADELERIAVPTTLIWGRVDLATPLAAAEAARDRHGWPLYVIDDCADDPPVERPEAFVDALRAAIGRPGATAALRQRLRGAAFEPGDGGFSEASALWNAAISRKPALVVRPTGTADVVAAIEHARVHRLPVAVRGGGHNIAGTALAAGGLTLDMSQLRTVVVDPRERTATVAPGCLLGDVDRETQLHGLATPLGFLSEVGVAGLTLGGGLGYLSRRFGWTVDNVLEVEIVTGDGQVRRASRHVEPELFWAVRGGGAFVGVVTSFTFRLHRVGPAVYGGLIAWPFERARPVLAAYRETTAAAPRELAVWLELLRAPEAPFVPPEWRGERICAMVVCHSGEQAGRDAALAPLRALGDPVFDLLREQPYAELQSQLDATEPKGAHYYWRTEYAAGLSEALLDELLDVAAGCPLPLGQVGVLHLGGAIGDRAGDDGAVGNRDAAFALGVLGRWEPGDPAADEHRRWIRAAGARLRPHSTGATYVNFQTADEGPERLRASYGLNVDRLADLKRRYDPDRLLRSLD